MIFSIFAKQNDSPLKQHNLTVRSDVEDPGLFGHILYSYYSLVISDDDFCFTLTSTYHITCGIHMGNFCAVLGFQLGCNLDDDTSTSRHAFTDIF